MAQPKLVVGSYRSASPGWDFLFLISAEITDLLRNVISEHQLVQQRVPKHYLKSVKT